MKKIVIAVFLTLVMIAVTAGATEPIKLKFSTVLPPPAATVNGTIKPWSEIVKEESGGTLEIEIYAGGVLGRNMRMYFKQLDSGVFDIALIYPTYFGERFPDVDVFNLPFMAENYIESAISSQRMFDKGLFRGFEKVEVLALIGTSPFYLNSTFPVRVPEDLKGHKCRTGAKFQADLITQLGMTPVGMGVSETAESMARGIVDATIASPNVMKMFRIADVAKNLLKVPFGNFPLLVAMSKKKYESLPPKAQEAIDKHRGEWLARFWAERDILHDNKVWKEFEQDPQHTIFDPKGEVRERWKAAIQPAVDKWKKESPRREELLEALQQELDQIRAGK